MEKWRIIFFGGVLLGIVVFVLDVEMKTIPDLILIILEVIAILLVFTGLIARKKNR